MEVVGLILLSLSLSLSLSLCHCLCPCLLSLSLSLFSVSFSVSIASSLPLPPVSPHDLLILLSGAPPPRAGQNGAVFLRALADDIMPVERVFRSRRFRGTAPITYASFMSRFLLMLF